VHPDLVVLIEPAIHLAPVERDQPRQRHGQPARPLRAQLPAARRTSLRRGGTLNGDCRPGAAYC
jgi:hypothetical protein